MSMYTQKVDIGIGPHSVFWSLVRKFEVTAIDINKFLTISVVNHKYLVCFLTEPNKKVLGVNIVIHEFLIVNPLEPVDKLIDYH